MLEKRNYAHNRTIDLKSAYPDGYINGQGVGAVAGMMYGFYHMAWNGCEMIALYNAMVALGRPADLAEISLEMYPKSAVAWGFFGSNPLVLDRYFKAHGIPCQKTYRFDSFFDALPLHRCGVLSFWNHRRVFGSLHTVMVKWQDGQIVEYNKSNGRAYPVPHDTRSLITSKKLFIVGYLLD